MQNILRRGFKIFGLLCTIFVISFHARASHIFGADLYYTHISGNSYMVNLAVYGDCSGSAFYTLSGATPQIDIYNGNTFINSVNLAIQPPYNGVEVSPVCPSQVSNTTCTNISNPLPGIKKFLYRSTVTLTGASTQWRFVFAGEMGGSSTAGRSSSITNIYSGSSGSPIQLVDTLNNTGSANSNSVYTTIPTPFYCISAPANYNPGAVDPNGDSLSFSLVSGIDASTGVSVNYVWPYNATSPLGVSAGSYSFNSVTGQLAFTPNVVQKALVVYNVREYRGGVLKGTSQREMTVVILSPCTNNPPTGSITSPSAGSLSGTTTLNLCRSVDSFDFRINPTDADGDTISMTVSGLPAGATFTITGNHTPSPSGIFRWVASSAAAGSYTFYVNYVDHGCPLSSQQTIAYTINVLPSPTGLVTVLSQATCLRQAIFTVTPGGGGSPYTLAVLSGSTSVHTITGITGTITDSVSAGTYTVRLYNSAGCIKDTVISLASPPLPSAIISLVPPLCRGGSDGAISVSGIAGTAPYLYAIGSGTYGTSGSFTGLSAAAYAVRIKDANGCIKDTTISIPNPAAIQENLLIRRPYCRGLSNGRVIIQPFGSIPPYTFALGSGVYSSSDTFSGLAAGTYTFHIMNANGCVDDTTVTLTDSVVLHGTVSISPVLCNGGTATVTVAGSGGFGMPYSYSVNGGTFGPFGAFTVTAGTDTFRVRDQQSCPFDTVITITQPAAIVTGRTLVHVACHSDSTGSITISATGGTPGYRYRVDGGTFGTTSTLSGLAAGIHTYAVSDSNSCVSSDTFTIRQPTPLWYDSIVLNSPVCNGGANGSITIYASGGVPAYSYAYNTSAYVSSSSFAGLFAGAYTLHIRDANGCIRDSLVMLTDPPAIVPSATVTPSHCATLADGFVYLSATGGTPAYQYALGSGAYGSTGTFGPLASGAYTFHVKDANNCLRDTVITVNNLYTVTATFVLTQPLCHGDTNGSITVIAAGATSPYVYAIGSGSFSPDSIFVHIGAGVVLMHVRDSSGCLLDTSITMLQPLPLTPLAGITMPSCFGRNDGVINVAAAGGIAPYSYSFNGGTYSDTVTYTGIGAGTDTITIRDMNGCMIDTVLVVNQPARLLFDSLVLTNVLCYNGGDGSVAVWATGGTTPYAYAANAGAYQVSNLLTGMAAGTNVIRVSDDNGCTVDTAVTLTHPAPLIISDVDIISPTCEGYTDGIVRLFSTGGTGTHDYSKDNVNFSTIPVFSGFAEGTYSFYVRDSNGCISDTAVTLTGYPHISIDSIKVKMPSCTGKEDGRVAVIVSGGNSPFTYTLNGQAGTTALNVFTNLGFGTYVLVVTDSTNCRKDSTFTIFQPDSIDVKAVASPNDCIGKDDNGSIMTTITGGTGPYTYLWSLDSATTPGLDHVPNGFYTVWVTDNSGCSDSTVVRVEYDNCCTPYVPNAFSPNADGKNDVFRLRYKGDVRIIEFSIYNRFGERVFTTSYSEDGWDGSYLGTACDMGTYYYYIRLLCGNLHENIMEFRGDVILMK